MSEYVAAWDPTDHSAWANTLGLIPTPLFGPDRPVDYPGIFTVLQDGRASSFTICSVETEALYFDNPLSWAWSANLNHALIINKSQDLMYLRRWDEPDTIRRFNLPSRLKGALELLTILEKAPPPPPSSDVVWHVLRAFRRLRSSLNDSNGLESIRTFNVLLAGAEAVRLGEIQERAWSQCRTIGNILELVNENIRHENGVDELLAATISAEIGELPLTFLHSSIDTNIQLEPDLLLRHAAGQLYQEAHLIIEREAQLRLPGMPVEDNIHGLVKRDVRFTPSSLARSLTQEALKAFGRDILERRTIEILDPACGSGIFLQEALRELALLGYHGHVILRGFDISPISCVMTRFCINRAKRDAEALGLQVTFSIQEENALSVEWGNPDIILMNPPFVPWQLQSQTERETTIHILDNVARGRADISMAFVWKGVDALYDGAVLASILPAPLLESGSGFEWREGLTDKTLIRLIGYFRGYGIFQGSAVEPALIVLQRKSSSIDDRPPIRLVIANEGSEDAALRALRGGTVLNTDVKKSNWEVMVTPAESFAPPSWLPRSGRHQRLVTLLSSNIQTTVGDLFQVHQGIRTGMNQTFILPEIEYIQLPENEQHYFRPIASNATINNGQLHKNKYVFYPYGPVGLVITTEEMLTEQVPTYYINRLLPNKSLLQSRSRIALNQWWVLTHERRWQWVANPKLVSKYFGESGGFAYDNVGDYVVLQGFAWLWNLDIGESFNFHETELPWAYLALLNSLIFEVLLDNFCPRVQGGQFDLSPRFVSRIPMPNLSDENCVPSNVIRHLSQMGYGIYHGEGVKRKQIHEFASRSYGISLEYLEDIDLLSKEVLLHEDY